MHVDVRALRLDPDNLPRMSIVTVVGLGPAGPELITSQARELIDSAKTLWVRTRKHPAASVAAHGESFDAVYESADTIEAVYREIVDVLVEAALRDDNVVYAVPGSPLVAEATVDLLRTDSRVQTSVLPGLSFLDLAWQRLHVDPFASSPRLVDGRRFLVEGAGERGPLLVAQCDAPWVLSEIKLAFEDETPEHVTVLQRLGLPDEAVFTVAWEDLDRLVDPDHLTSLWIPHLHSPVAYELARVNEVAVRLRKECPWDREQTHTSLSRYLIEEAYELIDAIDAIENRADDVSDADVDLIEELGDLLFQAFAHAAIGAEQGRFTIADVAQSVSDKLIERHPHVYGSVVAESSQDVMSTWEASKKASKGRTSLMDGIPRHLPALLYARKVLRKAQTTGIELADAELDAAELGDALLLVVNEALRRDDDPEEALRNAVSAFRGRFERAEAAAAADGIEIATAGRETAVRYWTATA